MTAFFRLSKEKIKGSNPDYLRKDDVTALNLTRMPINKINATIKEALVFQPEWQLKSKKKNAYAIPITGRIHSGKSTVCEALLRSTNVGILSAITEEIMIGTQMPKLYRDPRQEFDLIDCPATAPRDGLLTSKIFFLNPFRELPEEIKQLESANASYTQALIHVININLLTENYGAEFREELMWLIARFGVNAITNNTIQFVITHLQNPTFRKRFQDALQDVLEYIQGQLYGRDEKGKPLSQDAWLEIEQSDFIRYNKLKLLNLNYPVQHLLRKSPYVLQTLLKRRQAEIPSTLTRWDQQDLEKSAQEIKNLNELITVITFLKDPSQHCLHFLFLTRRDTPTVIKEKKAALRESLFREINASPGLPMGINAFFDQVILDDDRLYEALPPPPLCIQIN